MTRSAKLYRYKLPMDSGVILRSQKLSERVGFIAEITEGDKVGRGEIAPLSCFSLESTEEAGVQAQHQLEMWVRGGQFDYDKLFPSVAFGLSMAELELNDELPAEGNYLAAPLCTGDPDSLLPKLEAMDGKKVAKIKVGYHEPIRDGMLVNLFLEAIPELKLRLDANRSWDLTQAMEFAKQITPSLRQRISYVEEPCKQPGDSVSFAIDTGIAIAWDETIQHEISRKDFAIEDLLGVKTLVIKPTLIGSVQACIKLIEKAQAQSIQTVLSSSIESSFGLTQLARLAKWILPETVPGLDTVKFFECQLETAWPGCELPVVPLSEQEVMWRS
ncbi:o-succinylbenzoate synthase [Vibrio marisflavi]|uniref:o-succinylbenzoate synthase n=1 Tax=Vibrio marisflavi CECT 7928 TaxID=634439 RepID=A0ABN8E2Q8_9VIBR|nr:o-succinylbenzoate synthase [Vibrio marisflavi]CAH0539322.1 o-succinylbenzoate synthase [Vibrio marisflavi CECT 7928]